MGYTIIIIVTLFGFLALAWILLFPVYRFLQREEDASARWTEEALRERARRASEGDGADAPATLADEPPSEGDERNAGSTERPPQ